MALLDDVAALVKATAASVDDVAAAAGKAGAKAVSVVVDDTAVTPRYVEGIDPDRELPIIWRITLGSLRNKLLIILPAALLLSWLAPWALTPILMLGGGYLAFEGAEKLLEALHVIGAHGEEAGARDEKSIVSAAVRTDLILSAEIMVIALNEVDHQPVWEQAIILAVVGVVITALVYGVVGLIVKMDDLGLALARRDTTWVAGFGRGLVRGMPIVMSILSTVGVVAMLWVGGHLIVSGAAELGLSAPSEWVHHLEEAVAHATGPLGGFLGWLVETLCSTVAGLVIGSIVAGVVLGISALRHRGGKGDAEHSDDAAHPGDAAQPCEAAPNGGEDASKPTDTSADGSAGK